jgi:hypothetical protein
MSAISGWYPDPAGSPDLRFWDGERWGASTMPRSAPAPQQTATAVAAPPVAPAPAPAVSPQWAYSRPGIPYTPPPPLPKRGSRTPKLVGVIGAFVAVCVVAAVVSKVNDNEKTQKALQDTSIQLPEDVAGLHHVTNTAAVTQIETMANALPWTSHLVGEYALADGTPRAIVLIGKVGVTSSGIDSGLPKAESGFNSSLTRQGLPTASFHSVDAGPLGGRMDCGTVTASRSVTQCFFVDRATLGGVTMYDVDGSDDHTLALALRSAIETRS